MATQNHTAGPWRACGEYLASANIRGDNHADGTGAALASTGPVFHAYQADPVERAANITLMAASPLMLEALKLAEATIERLKGTRYANVFGTLDVVRDAIEKATALPPESNTNNPSAGLDPNENCTCCDTPNVLASSLRERLDS